MLIIEPDANTVFSRFIHNIGDITGTILAIKEINLSLGGTLDRDCQRSRPSLACPHVELCRFTFYTAFKPGTSCNIAEYFTILNINSKATTAMIVSQWQ